MSDKKMIAKITDECISCMACESVCAFGAIEMANDNSQMTVIPDKCVFCRACMGICPVTAIIETETED